jgi:hypothetical protein
MVRSLLVEAFLATSSHDLALLPNNHLNLLFFEQKHLISILQRRWKRFLLKMEAFHFFVQQMDFDLTPQDAQIKKHWQVGQLKPGDHVSVTQVREVFDVGKKNYVERTGYHHHLIYVGDEKFIEFTGPDNNKDNATITDTLDIDKFLEGLPSTKTHPKGFFYLIPYKMKPDSKISEEEARAGAVKTAKYFKDRPEEIGKYDVVKNNCEHFALRCKLGINRFKNTQVQKFIEFIKKDLEKKDSKMVFISNVYYSRGH